jgi:hypothetical protein
MPDEKPQDRAARRLAGAAGALGGTWLGHEALMRYGGHLKGAPFAAADIGKPLLEHPRMRATAPLVRKELARKAVTVPLEVGGETATKFKVFRGVPEKITSSVADLPSVFHEIGHAHMPVLGRVWNTAHTLARTPGADVLRAGLLLGAMSEPANEAGMHRFINEHAPMLMALSYAPKVAEEARASLSALRGLSHAGYPMAKGLKSMGATMGVYALPAIGATAAAALARNVFARRKEAAAGVPAQPKVTGQLRLSTTEATMSPVSHLKPKTTPPKPGAPMGTFAGIATAKPPSLTKYYRDATQSMVPGRGVRS